MSRISEYPEVNSLNDSDLLLIDQGGGVYKSVSVENMAFDVSEKALGPIYDAEVAHHVHPSTHFLPDLIGGIDMVANHYYDEGRSQGREDAGQVGSHGTLNIASGTSITVYLAPGHYYIVATSNGNGGVTSGNTITINSGASLVTFMQLSRSTPVSIVGFMKTNKSVADLITVQLTIPSGSTYCFIELGPYD